MKIKPAAKSYMRKYLLPIPHEREKIVFTAATFEWRALFSSVLQYALRLGVFNVCVAEKTGRTLTD